MNRAIFIDGDIEIFQVAAVHQTDFQFDSEEDVVPMTLNTEARLALKRRIAVLAEDLKANGVYVCLTDREHKNFRKDIYPDYKANRNKLVKPVLLRELEQYLMDTCSVLILPGLEADDVMGIYATDKRLLPAYDERIIVSADKDLNTVPGLHYNPNKSELGVYNVTQEEADRFFMMQTVMGDSTDNYPGCPNAGPKAAEKALDAVGADLSAMWDAVVGLYENAKEKGTKQPLGLTAEDALVQARLARILRKEDYKDKRPVLWNPPLTKEETPS